ncbi:MAG: hypothetical protein KDJ52_03880 [Anaerolineae bacterium]|nr:hypothetical protein [Anaerolineae bacterium]
MNRDTGNVHQTIVLSVTEWLFTVFVGHRSEGIIFYVRFFILLPLLILLFYMGVQTALGG